LGFFLSARHIPFLAFHVTFSFVCGLIRCYFTRSIPARKAQEGVGLVYLLCIYISLWFSFHYLLGDTRDRAGNRNVQFCFVFAINHFEFCLLMGTWFFLLLCASLFCMLRRSNGIIRGQGRGSGIGFRIGLAPRAEETGPAVQWQHRLMTAIACLGGFCRLLLPLFCMPGHLYRLFF
jgi:hypothetical protein